MSEKRHYTGEQHGQRLVQWLNEYLPNQREKRVQLLFKSVAALNQTLAQGGGHGVTGKRENFRPASTSS